MHFFTTTVLVVAAVLAAGPPEATPNQDDLTPTPLPISPKEGTVRTQQQLYCESCLQYCEDITTLYGNSQGYNCTKYLCLPECIDVNDDVFPKRLNCTVPRRFPRPTFKCDCPPAVAPAPLECPKPEKPKRPKGCPKCPTPCATDSNDFIQFGDDGADE